MGVSFGTERHKHTWVKFPYSDSAIGGLNDMICLHVNPSRRPLDEVIMTPCTFYWVASRNMMETIWNLIGALFTQKLVPLRFVRMKGILSAKLWDGFLLFRWTTAPLLCWNCSISTTNPPCLNLSSWLVGLCIFLAGWRVCHSLATFGTTLAQVSFH